jgi:hypothetical protein
MRITDVEALVLEAPSDYGTSADATEAHGPKHTCVVLVHTDEGITGVAQMETQPHVVRAIVDAPGEASGLFSGLKALAVGEDPLQIEALWDRLRQRLPRQADAHRSRRQKAHASLAAARDERRRDEHRRSAPRPALGADDASGRAKGDKPPPLVRKVWIAIPLEGRFMQLGIWLDIPGLDDVAGSETVSQPPPVTIGQG